jgi:3'-5' exonuclease
MSERIVVFDIETVPDLGAGRLMLGLEDGTPDSEVRELLGKRYAKDGQAAADAFIKVPLHRIVCLGAIYAERESRSAPWTITRSGVVHLGIRDERQIVGGFIDSLASTPSPQLIGFNSSSFDLPILRYRAFALGVAAHTIHRGNGKDYWYRFGRDHIDLCDFMSGFGASAKPSLAELSALYGIRMKMDGVDVASVEPMIARGRIEEVAAYCETDVMATYLLFLRFSLVIGETDNHNYNLSIASFHQFTQTKIEKRPYLAYFLNMFPSGELQPDVDSET